MYHYFPVVGVNFTANALRHHFLEHIKDSEWLNQEDYLLLLLDDGGLIVTANRREVRSWCSRNGREEGF